MFHFSNRLSALSGFAILALSVSSVQAEAQQYSIQSMIDCLAPGQIDIAPRYDFKEPNIGTSPRVDWWSQGNQFEPVRPEIARPGIGYFEPGKWDQPQPDAIINYDYIAQGYQSGITQYAWEGPTVRNPALEYFQVHNVYPEIEIQPGAEILKRKYGTESPYENFHQNFNSYFDVPVLGEGNRQRTNEIIADLQKEWDFSLERWNEQPIEANVEDVLPKFPCPDVPAEPQRPQFLPGEGEGCQTCATAEPGTVATGVTSGAVASLPSSASAAVVGYAESDEGRKCSQSYIDGRKPFVFAVSAVVWQEQYKAIEDFLEHCLTVTETSSLTDLIDPGALGEPSQVVLRDRGKIYNQVVQYNFVPGAPGNCHGLLTRNGQGGLEFLTARHCLVKPKELETAPFDSFEVRSLAGTSLRFIACAQWEMLEEKDFSSAEDQLVLPVCSVIRLSDGVDIANSVGRVAMDTEVSNGDRLLIANRIRFIDKQSDLARLVPSLAAEERFLFAEDDTPLCMVFETQSPYLMHNCQTERGSSGAPIFKIIEIEGKATLALVGIHTGFTAELGNQTTIDPQYIRNYGLVVNRT